MSREGASRAMKAEVAAADARAVGLQMALRAWADTNAPPP